MGGCERRISSYEKHGLGAVPRNLRFFVALRPVAARRSGAPPTQNDVKPTRCRCWLRLLPRYVVMAALRWFAERGTNIVMLRLARESTTEGGRRHAVVATQKRRSLRLL